MHESMELSNEERKVLSSTLAMIGTISMMSRRTDLVKALLMRLNEEEPIVAGWLVDEFEKLVEEGAIQIERPFLVREFITDCLINLGQVHMDTRDRFFEYSEFDEERKKKERDFIAVEFSKVLIEPSLQKELDLVMFKLGEKNDAMVN